MKWLTAKRQMKVLYGVAALAWSVVLRSLGQIPRNSNASKIRTSGALRRAI